MTWAWKEAPKFIADAVKRSGAEEDLGKGLTNCLTLIAWRESRGLPTAVAKSTGAAGMFQVMPSLTEGRDMFDPEIAIGDAIARARRIARIAIVPTMASIARGWRGIAFAKDITWIRSAMSGTLSRTAKAADATGVSLLRLMVSKVEVSGQASAEYWIQRTGGGLRSTATTISEAGLSQAASLLGYADTEELRRRL